MATRCPVDIPRPSSSNRRQMSRHSTTDGLRLGSSQHPARLRRPKGAPMAEATRRPSRWRVFAPDTAGAIYGTIAAMAVIAGAARDPAHGKALGLTVATLLVFWLAHVYAQTLSHHLRGERAPGWGAMVEAMAEERPLLERPPWPRPWPCSTTSPRRPRPAGRWPTGAGSSGSSCRNGTWPRRWPGSPAWGTARPWTWSRPRRRAGAGG